MKSISIIFLLFTAVSYSQIHLEAYAGVNFPLGNKSFSNFLSINFYPGINLGVSADYNILNIFAVSPFAEYTYYFFKNYNSGIPGYLQSNLIKASGRNTQFYKLGLNLKYYPSFLMAGNVYFLTGIMWNGVNPGSINVTWYDANRGYIHTSEQVDDKRYLSQNIGVGITIAKLKAFQVLIEGTVSTNYSDRLLGSVNMKFLF